MYSALSGDTLSKYNDEEGIRLDAERHAATALPIRMKQIRGFWNWLIFMEYQSSVCGRLCSGGKVREGIAVYTPRVQP
jgi:hypothetical protein